MARGGCAGDVLSVSNILFWGTTNYFAGKSELNPLLMTWSLGVEEQFYAVIPLLMVLMAGVRRTWILAATIAVCFISFVFAAILAPRYPMMVFYMLARRAHGSWVQALCWLPYTNWNEEARLRQRQLQRSRAAQAWRC